MLLLGRISQYNVGKANTVSCRLFFNRNYTVATGHKQKASRIKGVFTVTTPGHFLTCVVCRKEMKEGEKTLNYLRNAEYAIDHVHEKGCDEKYKKKYAVK